MGPVCEAGTHLEHCTLQLLQKTTPAEREGDTCTVSLRGEERGGDKRGGERMRGEERRGEGRRGGEVRGGEGRGGEGRGGEGRGGDMCTVHVLMRDEKEGRKKHASKDNANPCTCTCVCTTRTVFKP